MSNYAKYKDLGDRQEFMNTEKEQPRQQPRQEEIESIENGEHKKWLIQNNKVVVVDIYGDWCGPCKQIEPKYNELAQKYSRARECAIVKENVDKKISPTVRGVPTFQFFFKGQPAGIITGANIANVEQKIIQLLQIK